MSTKMAICTLKDGKISECNENSIRDLDKGEHMNEVSNLWGKYKKEKTNQICGGGDDGGDEPKSSEAAAVDTPEQKDRKAALKTLGLSETSTPTQKEIKKAYRPLALKYHPDRNTESDAAEKIMELNKAYELLLQGQKAPADLATIEKLGDEDKATAATNTSTAPGKLATLKDADNNKKENGIGAIDGGRRRRRGGTKRRRKKKSKRRKSKRRKSKGRKSKRRKSRKKRSKRRKSRRKR